MNLLIIAVIIFAVVLAVSYYFNPRRRAKANLDPGRYPFTQCRPLTEREQVLYWRLRKVMPEQMVLAQVGLSSFLRVEKGSNFNTWFNRINRMSVDFLVCLPDATIAAAIELDDSSHDRPDRIVADIKKDKALESAGIKFLRYRDVPTEEDLRKAFVG